MLHLLVGLQALVAAHHREVALAQALHAQRSLLGVPHGLSVDRHRRAVEIDPKYYAAHFQLASLLDRTNRLDEAASEYEVAAPGFRSSGDYHYRLGFVYFRLGRKDRARDSLRRAIDVAPGSRSAAKAGDLLKALH